MTAYWTDQEKKALQAGWAPDPEDFDQWKHPTLDGVYWGAMDIPEEKLL